MAIRLGQVNPLKGFMAGLAVSKIYLGDSLVWTPLQPQRFTFSTVGPYTFDTSSLPDGTLIDAVLLGGAAGGDGGGRNITGGGAAGGEGNWLTATLIKGVDFTGNITGTVGAGGAGGWPMNQLGGNGGATTASAAGIATLTAAGGGRAKYGYGGWGNPGNKTLNGQTYNGGGSPSATPGCGGGGGANTLTGGTGGGPGGAGRSWFYVRLP